MKQSTMASIWENQELAQSTTTAAGLAVAGALTRFIMAGKWTWRTFMISMAGSVAGFFAAVLIVAEVPQLTNAPDPVKGAIYYFSGMMVDELIRRLTHLKLTAKIGSVEIESKGDDA